MTTAMRARGSDRATASVWVLPLRRQMLPGGKRLWVAVDRDGLRHEYVLPAWLRAGAHLVPLAPAELTVTVGAACLQRIVDVDTEGRMAASPAVMAFVDWLAELIELGLKFGDPHPELVSWWMRACPARCSPLPWGEAAAEVLRWYGIWAPPLVCPDCGAPPDGRAALDLSCADCRPLGRTGVVLTPVGNWLLPLARWLDIVERVYEDAFARRPKSTTFVRELGVRGMLTR